MKNATADLLYFTFINILKFLNHTFMIRIMNRSRKSSGYCQIEIYLKIISESLDI